MSNAKPAKTALCIMGLPDSREVKVEGYAANGTLIYNWDGNSDFHNQLATNIFRKTYLPIIWANEPPIQIAQHDVVINNINDADISSNSLKMANNLTRLIEQKWPQAKIFNHPAKIADTTRNRIYELYKNVAGIYIPKTVRIAPQSAKQAFDNAKSEVGLPFLIRPCGAHQSHGLQLIASEQDLPKLEKYAFNSQQYYATEFKDYRSADGLYRKARIMVIGGKMIARHFMTGPEWLVHGDLHEQFMATNDAAKAEEENFLNNFANILGQPQQSAIMEIYKRSGLDYLGFDFAIMPNGELLIFEINAAQNSFLNLDFKVFPYMKKTRDDIILALNQALVA